MFILIRIDFVREDNLLFSAFQNPNIQNERIKDRIKKCRVAKVAIRPLLT